MRTEPVATPTVESRYRRDTCPRCQRSFEVPLAVDGLGAVCPGCLNVLEEGAPAAEEVGADA